MKNKKIKKQAEKKEKSQTESKEKLENLLATYTVSFNYFSSRLDRLKKLLLRNSTKKLSKEKRERLIRRCLTAEEEHQFSSTVVDQAVFRMSQLFEDKQ